MAESQSVEGKTTKSGKPRQVGHIEMMVINDLKAETITSLVKDNVSEKSIIDSDDSTSYVGHAGTNIKRRELVNLTGKSNTSN